MFDLRGRIALVQRVLAEHGRCDVLVNNAGIGHVGTILTTAPEDLARLWSVNLRGMHCLARGVARDESAFVTGSTFVIDGGYLCGK